MNNSELKNVLLRELEDRLLILNDSIAIENKGKQSREYKPYLINIEDNLISDTESKKSFLLEYYSPSERENLKAIRSSAALTYNTFINIVGGGGIIYEGQVYNAFAPEVPHTSLINGGKAKIDALLNSEDKKTTLMIEMKMFEHYDKSIAFNSKSYLCKERYGSQLSDLTKDVFIGLFTEIETLISEKGFTRYDIQQMAKHLLSILSNTSSKDYFSKTRHIKLLSVSWLASKTDILKDEKAYHFVSKVDKRIEAEAHLALQMLNSVLKKLNIDNIETRFMDYDMLIKNTNIKQRPYYSYLLTRYL